MSIIPYATLWGVLVLAVVVLAVYRSRLAGHIDELVHLEDTATGIVSDQAQTAQRLNVIDRWGKGLTVVAVVTGLALGAVFMYQIWQQTSASSM